MKMHGLGNDFMVVDRRGGGPPISADVAQRLSDRRRGVGFDQLAVIEGADGDGAGVVLTFFNADGSTSAACGNAARCIARHLMDEIGASSIALRTERGILQAEDAGDGLTRVNMGLPITVWSGIPLAHEADTLHLPIEGDPVATSMGNPHCTFFVDDSEAVDIAGQGPEIEHHPLFPERTNVQFCHLISPDRLRVRVWERGAGVTPASGSSSCAAVVAAARRKLAGRSMTVILDGGEILIDWRDDGVWMTGPAEHVFSGILEPASMETV